MALPASIAANIKNGGIRQGKVYLVSSGTEGDGTNPGDFTVMGLGVTKNLVVSTSDNESDQDSQGRTWAISTSDRHAHAALGRRDRGRPEPQGAG
jgi:hypothetical protein